jgi:hypothetical protein
VSALALPNWRGVGVRIIVPDAELRLLFPYATLSENASWESCDPRWLLLTTALIASLRQQAGPPVDFQRQPQGYANDGHDERRRALGMRPLGDAETPAGLYRKRHFRRRYCARGSIYESSTT